MACILVTPVKSGNIKKKTNRTKWMCVQYVRFHLLYIFCLFHSTSQQHLYIYPYGAAAHTWEPVWCGRVEGNWWLWITNPALSLAQLSTDGSSYRRSRHVTAPYQPNGSSKSIKDFNFVSKEEFYFWCSIFFPHFRVFVFFCFGCYCCCCCCSLV